jgi:hypothetical protein
MGRLVVEDAAELETGLPWSCGTEEGLVATEVGTLALDLRLDPNPRPLKREFKLELIRSGRA